MERDPQKVSAVLADPTRYKVYQAALMATGPVTAQEVARQFSLHPNVARLHLGKLVEIGLMVQQSVKTGKGGRPGYRYSPSGSAVSLTVPARDFYLLADLLVQSLALLGEGAIQAVGQIGRTFGRRLGREAITSVGESELEESYRSCATALQRLGVISTVNRSGDGPAHLVLKTCGFQEVAAAHPDHVCLLCKAMVEGITEVCLEAHTEVSQSASLPKGDKECVYEMNDLLNLE